MVSDHVFAVETTGVVKTIFVYNATGQTVMHRREKVLDISMLPQGMYMVKIVLSNGEYTDKIVKH